MDLLWATFGASGTARFPDRICEVCTAPLQHRIQLWFRPHGMMQAYGGDPSGCLLTLSHRITQSARPLWHTAQTMSRAHARTHARMCARSQRSWPQVTSTSERRLALRTSIVARAQGTEANIAPRAHAHTRSTRQTLQNRPHTNSTSAGDAPVFCSVWECRELLNPHTAGAKRKLSERTGPACRSLVTKPRTLFFAVDSKLCVGGSRRTPEPGLSWAVAPAT